jgi:N,N'-diacetyllegionaminate synthase
MTSNVYIIAEIGVNHNGSLEIARKLILAAKECGADAVKFQSFNADDLAHIKTPKVEYQLAHDSISHHSMLKNLELTHEQQYSLKEYCDKLNIDFLSTPYSVKEVHFLQSLGVKYLKIASADIVDIPLLEAASKTRIPTILSSGMATIEEIMSAQDIFRNYNTELIILHCTSEYPTASHNANLLKMKRISLLNNEILGFSDHTIGNVAAIMAVALGATFIEKHITLDIKDDGPDHLASMPIDEFNSYVANIRTAEISMGTLDFHRTAGEDQMAKVSRKSLHLRNDLENGSILLEENLELRRPGTGIFWKDRDSVLNRVARRNLNRGDIISLEDFN